MMARLRRTMFCCPSLLLLATILLGTAVTNPTLAAAEQGAYSGGYPKRPYADSQAVLPASLTILDGNSTGTSATDGAALFGRQSMYQGRILFCSAPYPSPCETVIEWAAEFLRAIQTFNASQQVDSGSPAMVNAYVLHPPEYTAPSLVKIRSMANATCLFQCNGEAQPGCCNANDTVSPNVLR